MWDLGGLRDRGDFARRLAVTAVALIVSRLGVHIPLPGLDPIALGHLYSAGGPAIERISILALGIYPLVGVLILAELAKLVVPALRRWERADARNRDSLNSWIVLLAIGFAIMQGAGIAKALEDVKTVVAEPGISFRIGCMVTLVAGTALVIWLADLITRHGLGSGVWLLFIIPTLVDFPTTLAALRSLNWQGEISGFALFLCLALIVIAVAAIVALLMTSRDTLQAAAACLWPVLLSYTLLTWLLTIVGLAVSRGYMTNAATWAEPGGTLRLLLLAGLLGFLVSIYGRIDPAADAAPTWAVPRSITWIVLAAITVASEALPRLFQLPVPIHAEALIPTTLVAVVILTAWWRPQRA